MTEAVALPAPRGKFSDLVVLTKARLNALVVFTTAGGYYLGASAGADLLGLLATCLGTALVASGAAAANQVAERDVDRQMNRTRSRPVAEGRMGAGEGSAIGLGLTAAGLVVLGMFSGWLATAIAAVTFAIYVVVYTPMKRLSSLATIVGAVPGALPPLIGWAAARGTIAEPLPWSLFAIMFLWQLPHFLAIAWMFREDYARAGLPMLPVVDVDGSMTGRQTVVWAAALIPVSELPYLLGETNGVYAIGALVLGVLQLALAVRFAFTRSRANARALFLGSITYLPLLMMLMAGAAGTRPSEATAPARAERVEGAPASEREGGAAGAKPPGPISVPFQASLNAALNATAGTLLLIGFALIRRKRVEAHRRVMISACVVSGLFLVSYVIYHAQVGSKPYGGTGAWRVIYYSILIPHVVLAAAVLPLAIVTLRRGLIRDVARHRRIARITLPIWLFVSVTGVVVYFMLY